MEDHIGAMLADVSRLIRRSFDERARGIGVTRPQWLVLTRLHRHEGCHQGRLAELLDVEPITLSRMVDRMQESGLVERRPDPDDRRAWRLFLTGRAQALMNELRPLGREVMDIALEGVSETRQRALRSTLEQIRQNLSRHAGDEAAR
jgi:DNA-binding MarR family transcriptional regulator